MIILNSNPFLCVRDGSRGSQRATRPKGRANSELRTARPLPKAAGTPKLVFLVYFDKNLAPYFAAIYGS